MRITPERLQQLQALLKAQTGRDYSLDETQVAGFAIMRFVLAKKQRENEQKQLKNKLKPAKIDTVVSA